MTQDERLIELEQRIKRHGKVTLEEICQQYGISTDSARRDLVRLSHNPQIMRIRGGAILAETRVGVPFVNRPQFDQTKQRLAQGAVRSIASHEILFIDAGTTSVALARQLVQPATVITNSPEVLNEAIGKPHIAITVLGGSLDAHSHAILGSTTVAQIRQYHADRAIIGVSALSAAGITTETEADAQLKLAMAQQARKVVCITAFEKFNTQLMHQSCGWADIDQIVTDRTPPEAILALIEQYEIELLVVDNDPR